jgi:hypothetical protein
MASEDLERPVERDEQPRNQYAVERRFGMRLAVL